KSQIYCCQAVAVYKLTKSRFISGWQCLKKLWLETNRKDLLPEIDEVQQAIFDQGTAGGKLAQELFPGGVLIPADIDKALRLTKTSKAPTLFEACILSDGELCKVDVLKREGRKLDIIEVKSGTRAKKEHVPDVAVQRFVAEKAGFQIRKCLLMHLNSGYVREAELELEKLFSIEDLTEEVQEFLPQVPGMLEEQFSILEEKGMPSLQIGSLCSSPYTCQFIPFCWDHMPENHIKSVPRLSWQ
ncbi:MAG: Dna2/Cas4 domain-containing protein, partial [Candidatus Aenigmarchaeota archaeon]|nr:Dna2/Cas4 domain-containing protein [Candidatus Aenigmarchaeota archaeon]